VENLIAVGRYDNATILTLTDTSSFDSYNNVVTLIDRRKATIPLSEIDVGGGVWRVKWNPEENRKGDLLVA